MISAFGQLPHFQSNCSLFFFHSQTVQHSERMAYIKQILVIACCLRAILCGTLLDDNEFSDPSPLFKLCVTIDPPRISSRLNQTVRVKCTARVCSTSHQQSPETITGNEYRLDGPVFDLSTQFRKHMSTSNGSCDADKLTCSSVMDLNMDSVLDPMDQSGLEVAEFKCTVAGYSAKNELVIGEAIGLVKYFQGKSL